jgi:hypothetical protein
MKSMVITYSDDFAFFSCDSTINILTGVESGCFNGDSYIIREMALLHLCSSVLSWI